MVARMLALQVTWTWQTCLLDPPAYPATIPIQLGTADRLPCIILISHACSLLIGNYLLSPYHLYVPTLCLQQSFFHALGLPVIHLLPPKHLSRFTGQKSEV